MHGDPALALDPEFPNLDPAVVQGYRSALENQVAEILDGELVLMPRPHRRHVRASSRLDKRLGPFDDPDDGDPGGWVILVEPELRLGRKPDVVVPDLAGWRRERVTPDFFADEMPPYFDLAPDWVCEVLSPSTQRIDRGKKRRIYRRERVGHLWLLDPVERALEVYRLADGRWLELDTYEGEVLVRAEPFDAIELSLAALWAP